MNMSIFSTSNLSESLDVIYYKSIPNPDDILRLAMAMQLSFEMRRLVDVIYQMMSLWIAISGI